MKRNLLGIAAVIIAVAASAFTAPSKNAKFATLYRFDGTVAEMHDASKYTVVTTPPSSCPTGSVRPCYISINQSLSSWLEERPEDEQILDDATATKN